MVDVSFVIICYNHGKYIEECVTSCLLQLHSTLSYEVIVVDDGSTDETSDVLRYLNSPKMRKFRIENSGIELASNFGFAKCRGRYIVRVDADDKVCFEYLNYVAAYLDHSSGYFYGDYRIIDRKSDTIKSISLPCFDPLEVRSRGDFLATGTLYDASLLQKYGGYKTGSKNSGLENYEFILRMLKDGIRGTHIPQYLFYYRWHESNMSLTNRSKIITNGYYLFKKLDLGEFKTNRYHPFGLELK